VVDVSRLELHIGVTQLYSQLLNASVM
jgi:hypothetical protein